MSKDSYILGQKGEKLAKEYLEKNGYLIIETNFHSRFGEIDIIAKKNEILHFIEVKTTEKNYDALFRITPQKYEKILRTINFFILKSKFNLDYQVDAIIINDKNIELIKNISY